MKLDISNKNLQRIEPNCLSRYLKHENSDEQHIEIVLLDNNSLSKLENLDKFTQLKHLSLTNNRLVEIKLISKLINLQFVNLLNNSLTNLNAFKDLKYLTWLNVSGNQIKSLEALKANINLEYIDASDNSISNLSDLSGLTNLETLNLNGNEISSLEVVPTNFSHNLKQLFISFNAIDDLNEISYLTHFDQLENLSIANNPCVSYSSGTNYVENMFNYRPFILNWCVTLNTLDGVAVSQKEYLKSEWLYSQGKGRHFRPGQHPLLIEYLIKACPYTATESIEEEVRLSKVLEKKESYQTEKNHKDSSFTNQQGSYTQRTVCFNNNTNIKKHPQTAETVLLPHPNSYFSASENNLIDDINLSSSGSTFGGDLEDHLDYETNLRVYKLYGDKLKSKFASKLESDNMSDEQDHANKTRYDEYDSRPIKPLDKNLLDKQLSEYTEISSEELEQLKLKTIQHIRAKTAEVGIKLPQQKNFTRTPTRKLSFNSNQSIINSQPKPQTSRIRRRTVDELNLNKVSSPQNKTKLKTNIQRNSPKPTTSNYLSHLTQVNNNANSKIDSNKNTASIKHPLINKNKQPVNNNKTALMSTKTLTESDDDIGHKHSNENLHDDETSFNDKKKSRNENNKLLNQIKHSEIHSRIQKQRQEMLLSKQKSLIEFKNQLKRQEEAKKLEVIRNKIYKNITFEDQCAIKIQSAWRGYLVRKTQMKKIERVKKFKSIISYLDMFRKNLNDISTDHKNFKNMHSEGIEKIWKAISAFKTSTTNESTFEDLIKSKIEPIGVTNTSNSSSSNESEIKRENRMLKQKIFLLEERCASLEEKLNIVMKHQSKDTDKSGFSSRQSDLSFDKHFSASTEIKIQPKIEIYPPLRVRLQKLNEKRVALKWSVNPKNALIELTGYNIYINGKLCGKMGPNDNIASINGINQEGEYKIFIRSYFANTESEDSNEVVTRVKRKQTVSASNKSAVESDENNISNNMNDSNVSTDGIKNQKSLNEDLREQIKYKSSSQQVSNKENNDEMGALKTDENSSNKRNPVAERKDLWEPNTGAKFQLNNFNPSFVNNRDEKLSPTENTNKESSQSENVQSNAGDLGSILETSGSSTSSTSKTTTTTNVLTDFLKPIKSSVSPALNLADIINSVKFSTSEPNLSNHNSSNSNLSNNITANTKNRDSLVRQSISFNNDELEDGLDIMKFEIDSKKENLKDTDESKSVETKSLKNHVSNGKILNQVQNVKAT